MSNCSKKRAKMEAVKGGSREANAAVATAEGLGIIAALASRLQKKLKNLVLNVASYFLLLLLSYLHLSISLDKVVGHSPVWAIRGWITLETE